MVKVQRDGVLQVVEKQRVLGAVGENLADINPVGEEEHWLWAWGKMIEAAKETGRGQSSCELVESSEVLPKEVSKKYKWRARLFSLKKTVVHTLCGNKHTGAIQRRLYLKPSILENIL